jgi:DNA repair protein RadC
MKTTPSTQLSMNFTQVAEVELVYRSKVKPSERPKISGSSDAYKIFRETWDHSIEHHETFRIMLLNRSNKVLGIATISTGGISGTVTDIRIIFQYAIKANACSIILAHNHPSGETRPSEADSRITQKLKEGGNLLDIAVLDHIILTPEDKYLSFADEGLL